MLFTKIEYTTLTDAVTKPVRFSICRSMAEVSDIVVYNNNQDVLQHRDIRY